MCVRLSGAQPTYVHIDSDQYFVHEHHVRFVECRAGNILTICGFLTGVFGANVYVDARKTMMMMMMMMLTVQRLEHESVMTLRQD